MTETHKDEKVCGSCGAEIRSGSAFCYSCGKVIAGDPAEEVNEPASPVTAKLTAPPSAAKAAKADEPPQKMPTAASMRKRTKRTEKPVKPIVWRERDDLSPGFLIGVAVLAVVSALLLAAAYYLR